MCVISCQAGSIELALSVSVLSAHIPDVSLQFSHVEIFPINQLKGNKRNLGNENGHPTSRTCGELGDPLGAQNRIDPTEGAFGLSPISK